MQRLFSQIMVLGISGVLLMLLSCSTPEQIVVENHAPKADNKYDSEFPAKSVSKDLEFLSTTVKKLDCLVLLFIGPISSRLTTRLK